MKTKSVLSNRKRGGKMRIAKNVRLTEEQRVFKILIQIPCPYCVSGKIEIHTCDPNNPVEGFECPGDGLCGETATVKCESCFGTNFREKLISLGALKLLLEGRKL